MPTLDWIGKDAVIRHHKEVPIRLLEADAKLSHGDPEDGNLIVQGDNLHALKALLPKYAGRVKCIYIDPPYNTGNEGWVYNDNVSSPEIEKWLGQAVGREAEDLTRHDKWLCMMYPRLVLLRQFLSEDGAIFVSIDENEVAYLKLLLTEVFGGHNFVEQIIWKKSYGGGAKEKHLVTVHEYCFVFAKNFSQLSEMWLPADPDAIRKYYKHQDSKIKTRGPYRLKPLEATKSMDARENLVYGIPAPDGSMVFPKRQWWWSKARTFAALETDQLVFLKAKDGSFSVQYKQYLRDENGDERGAKPFSIFEGPYTQKGTAAIRALFDDDVVFQFPKPPELIQRLIALSTDKDSIVLDSFAGSGTTGHAVVSQNAEDGGSRRFILVEMSEQIATGITAKRVRRICGGYRRKDGKNVEGLGGGFQFCRLSDEPLFNEFGDIRDDVTFAQLADFVWFSESGTGYTSKGDSPLLGVHDGRAIYLLFNGILGDRRVNGGNVLTKPVLDSLPEHDGPKVIYAAATRLGSAALQREGIEFKQTPYAIEV